MGNNNNIFGTFFIMNQADIKNKTENVGVVPHCLGGNLQGKNAYLKMGVPVDIFNRVTIQEDMVAGLLVYDKKEFHRLHDGADNFGMISDGYHTLDELYEHRIVNFMAVCKLMKNSTDDRYAWRSERHSDGSKYDGWFILGVGVNPGEQITYHLPMSKWEAAGKVVTLTYENAPEWDGHTAADVLERLSKL